MRLDSRAKQPKQTRGTQTAKQKSQESVLSDTEFQPKPLTRAERLKLNVSVTAVVVGILLMGGVILHFHVDPISPYQTATPAPAHTPAKKI